MAKVIKYQICTNDLDDVLLTPVIMGWNEINEELAKKEAYRGAYTIEDDGPEAIPTDADRIAELEEALALLLSGVTE